MTQKRLDQYRALCGEIADLERRIDAMRDKGPSYVADIVIGSRPKIPYDAHAILIAGHDEKYEDKLERMEKSLEERRDKLIDELIAIEHYVETVTDSIVRQVISLRYIQGKSWPTTSEMIYNRLDKGDVARMRLVRYLESEQAERE